MPSTASPKRKSSWWRERDSPTLSLTGVPARGARAACPCGPQTARGCTRARIRGACSNSTRWRSCWLWRLSRNCGLVPKNMPRATAVSALTGRLPLMISLIVDRGIPVRFDRSAWERPKPSRNSSLRMRPGVARRIGGWRVMGAAQSACRRSFRSRERGFHGLEQNASGNSDS